MSVYKRHYLGKLGITIYSKKDDSYTLVIYQNYQPKHVISNLNRLQVEAWTENLFNDIILLVDEKIKEDF